jgi:hypothetical protein
MLPLYYYFLYYMKIKLGLTIFIGSIYSSIFGLIYLGVAVFGLLEPTRRRSQILLGISIFLTIFHLIAGNMEILDYKLGHHILIWFVLSGIFLLRLHLIRIGKIVSA